jgi:hypothetical protein
MDEITTGRKLFGVKTVGPLASCGKLLATPATAPAFTNSRRFIVFFIIVSGRGPAPD